MKPGPKSSADSTLKRFWAKVMPEPNSGCYLWLGTWDRYAYGSFYYNGRAGKAHRFSYEIHKGQIPNGLVIDHLCRNPYCVNPDHMEAVTYRTNIMRGINHVAFYKQRTHCAHGHEWTPENTGYYSSDKTRFCRSCKKPARVKALFTREQKKEGE